MIENSSFTGPFLVMPAEAFGVSEMPSGYFLDTGQSGLMGTINALDARTACAARTRDDPSIAAHCGHILYLFRFYAAFERGETPAADWPGSWKTPDLDDAGWDTLRHELQTEYETLVDWLQKREAWPDQALGASMMLLAHCAYHVGEIKQRLSWVGVDGAARIS